MIALGRESEAATAYDADGNIIDWGTVSACPMYFEGGFVSSGSDFRFRLSRRGEEFRFALGWGCCFLPDGSALVEIEGRRVARIVAADIEKMLSNEVIAARAASAAVKELQVGDKEPLPGFVLRNFVLCEAEVWHHRAPRGWFAV